MKNVFMSVQGESMSPYLVDGDLVEVEPLGYEKIKTGDVIVFEAEGGKKIIHRVLSKRPLLIKGDSSKRYDHRLYEEFELLGFVRGRVKKIKPNELKIIPLSSSHGDDGGVSKLIKEVVLFLLVKISNLNRYRFVLIHRVFSLCVKLLGALLRAVEDLLSQSANECLVGFEEQHHRAELAKGNL